jgi:hypothetical protein
MLAKWSRILIQGKRVTVDNVNNQNPFFEHIIHSLQKKAPIWLLFFGKDQRQEKRMSSSPHLAISSMQQN